ncbi:MAG: hypothetical protein KBS97_00990 [Firmicutes bacterium]|nr:hypothetical protein [Candidatus Fiminaster equi]
MKTFTISYLITTLVVAVFCYLTTSNIFFGIAVIVIYSAYYFLYLYKRIKNYNSLVKRVHSCYFFINSFLITLSVKESFAEAYESGLRVQDSQLHLFTNELNELSDYDKVKYLKNYFKLAIYKMFLNVLEIYQDQGGNILTMSDNLMRECTRTEKTLTDSSNLGVKHLIEFIILWALSFAILLFMKFGIREFYDKMLKNPIFSPLIFIFFLLCLLSVHLFIKNFMDLSIKEDKEE